MLFRSAATKKPEATPVAAPAAALPEDGSREQVANLLGIKRLEQMADRYLKDLRATAYIEKRI